MKPLGNNKVTLELIAKAETSTSYETEENGVLIKKTVQFYEIYSDELYLKRPHERLKLCDRFASIGYRPYATMEELLQYREIEKNPYIKASNLIYG